MSGALPEHVEIIGGLQNLVRELEVNCEEANKRIADLEATLAERDTEIQRSRAIIDRCEICRNLLDGERTIIDQLTADLVAAAIELGWGEAVKLLEAAEAAKAAEEKA